MTGDDFFDEISKPCPVAEGARIELIGVMREDPHPIEPGTRGTVRHGNGGQIWVDWDNGRKLILLTSDPWRELSYSERIAEGRAITARANRKEH